MCGIAGIVDLEHRPIDPSLLLKMSRAIEHRGPDDEGYLLIDGDTGRCQAYAGAASQREISDSYPRLGPDGSDFCATMGLAHRRFSIIDLTPSGHQPLFDRERRCSVILNGEIYNYLELREELESKGRAFVTQSDTEVLLEAYKEWGIDCLRRLNGFWALALYDFSTRRLVISRDRLGKKPLYWARKQSRLYFASEIKALLSVPEISSAKRVNEAAVYLWLGFGLKDVDHTTFFEEIHMFPSAAWTDVDENFPNGVSLFWKPPKQRMKERELSVEEASRAIREDALSDAVRIRLRADVPWCVELSGGMDSSSLVALAARHTNERVQTCTARFEDHDANEEPFARSVSARYGSDHRMIDASLDGFWSQVGAFTRLEEEPYHSPNLQTNQVLWAALREGGTKVSLNGAGGDELFAGYTNYFYQAQTEFLERGQFALFAANAWNWSENPDRKGAILIPLVNLLKHAVSPLFTARMLSRIKRVRLGLDFIRAPPAVDRLFQYTLSEALWSDLHRTKIPYWLRSGDKGYMGIPLEVRAPFLDYRVVELALRLPLGYLIRDGWHKWILRVALQSLLPPEVTWRRRKVGFPFPANRFYAENRVIIDTLLDQSSNPYLDFSKRDQFSENWHVLSFLLWYEMFFNENAALFQKLERLALERLDPPPLRFSPAFQRSCGR